MKFSFDAYQNVTSTLNQMQNVIEASTSCFQKWSFNCKSDYRIRMYYVHSRIATNKKGTVRTVIINMNDSVNNFYQKNKIFCKLVVLKRIFNIRT